MKYFGITVTRSMQIEHFAKSKNVPAYAAEAVFNASTLSRGPAVNVAYWRHSMKPDELRIQQRELEK